MTSPQKHVLFILDYYLPHQGGAEKLFSQLIERLLNQGDKVTVITTKHKKSLPSQETHGNLTIKRKGSSRYSLLFRGIILGICEKKNAPDLIHTTSYAGALPAWIVSKILRKPITVTIHEVFGSLRDEITSGRAWLWKKYEKLLCKISYDKIITVSLYTKECLIKRYGTAPNKISTIYNGVDDVFHENKGDISFNTTHPVAFYFGHCGYSKGIDAYIDALPLLWNTYPQTSFVFNLLPSKNTGKIQKKLRILSKTIPITVYNGLSQEALIKEIKKSSFVVVPSRSEGFGLAAAEVCTLGVPLLTTGYGALSEVVNGSVVTLQGLTHEDFLFGWENMLFGKTLQLTPKEFHRNSCFEQYDKIRNKSIKQ